MKKVIFGGLLAGAISACVHTYKQSESNSDLTRKVSSEDEPQIKMQAASPMNLQNEAPMLVYITYGKNGSAKREAVSAARWNGFDDRFDEASREDFLRKLYFAETRNLPLKGARHAACFQGLAQNVADSFFNADNNVGAIRNIAGGHVEVKASTDGRLLGLKYNHQSDGSVSFRIFNCDAGKGSISENAGPQPPATATNPQRPISIGGGKGVPDSSSENNYGFTIVDSTTDSQVKRRFALRANYDQVPVQTEDAERPWKGLNLRDPVQALKFALMAQVYFYENMANQNANPDDNFIAENSKVRFWCHMPWMNVGLTGREAIHGLTQERDMRASTQIPVFRNATAGSNWGVAYFNAPGCRTLNRIFGSAGQPKAVPDFEQKEVPAPSMRKFDNGTMVTKILFTTADFPEIKDAFSWNANVSEPGSTVRRVKSVRHVQMDISVRDDKLGGVSAALSHWAMAGFYYDPNYDYDKDIKPILKMENPLKQIKNLPKAFLKMRPMGVQTGFDTPATKDTILFPGASANGAGNRLNGPADNPRSSCLGCHGTAGTTVSMSPGFLSFNMFEPYKEKITLDFNQQLALARANYETHIK